MVSREGIAHIEIGHTNVSRKVAVSLFVWFIAMLALLPAVEIGAQFTGEQDGATETSGGAQVPPLQELVDIPKRVAAVRADPSNRGAWRELIASNRALLEGLDAFETGLEGRSAVGRALRPPTQRLLSGALGAGNERVYVGKNGWLFYRPDVEYVTGRGFLESGEMERRKAETSEYEAQPQPDPRPAIQRFKRDLEARGIALVLVPTPAKPTIHARELSDALDDTHAVPQNASYRGFVEQLRAEGVLVFDPAAEVARQAAHTPQYLATDTHWRPETVQHVAKALVAFLDRNIDFRPVESPRYATQRREAQQIGDTAAMLDLPADQTLYPSERVALRFVADAAGDPWRPRRDADILLLGDSFTNMYSLPTMGWGEAAGLAEQLSYELQRPLDRIVQNDQGAHATRAILQRELASDATRLSGKRIIIWQFAARELSFGDWKVIDLPAATP